MNISNSIIPVTFCVISITLSIILSEGIIVVEKEKDVFTYKPVLEAKQGRGMGDGQAFSYIKGFVLDAETLLPIPNVKIETESQRGIGPEIPTFSMKTGAMGEFVFIKVFFSSSTTLKGASIVTGARKALATFSSPGYQTSQVLLDFWMPPLIVLMKKVQKK
jgi:hypothetical protein